MFPDRHLRTYRHRRPDPSGIAPSALTVFHNEVLFSGLDQNGRAQLWVTDGTVAGTHELAVAGTAPQQGLQPSNFVVYDGQVLFSGLNDQGLLGLWTTDGTAAGTHEVDPISNTWSTGLSSVGLTEIGTPVVIAGGSGKLCRRSAADGA